MNYLAKRLDAVKPSASAAVSQNAKALKAEGHDVIDLGLGEPDFDTPAHIVEAAYQAAKVGETRYPPTDGTAALKLAIIDKFKRDNTLSVSPSEIIVETVPSKSSLMRSWRHWKTRPKFCFVPHILVSTRTWF